MQVIKLKGKNKRNKVQLQEVMKKQQHIRLTISTDIFERQINTEKTLLTPQNRLVINCCDIYTSKQKTEVEMPKKYQNKKQKRLAQLQILDDSICLPSQFSLRTYIPPTSESQKNDILWNLDSPVNKLYI